MRARAAAGVLVTLTLTMSGCATSQEWSEWQNHPSHFASGGHMGFSIRNREGASQRVTRNDVELARSQGWWGEAIAVDQRDVVEK